MNVVGKLKNNGIYSMSKKEVLSKIKEFAGNSCDAIYANDIIAYIQHFGETYILPYDFEVLIDGEKAIEMYSRDGKVYYLMKNCIIVNENAVAYYKRIRRLLSPGVVIDEKYGEPVIMSRNFKIESVEIEFKKGEDVSKISAIYEAIWGENPIKEIASIEKEYPLDAIRIVVGENGFEAYWKKISARDLFPVLKNPEDVFGTNELYIAEIKNGFPRKVLVGKIIYNAVFNGDKILFYARRQVFPKEVNVDSYVEYDNAKKFKIGFNKRGKDLIRRYVGKEYKLHRGYFKGKSVQGVLYPVGLIKISTRDREYMQRFGVSGKYMKAIFDMNGNIIFMKIDGPEWLNDSVVDQLLSNIGFAEYSREYGWRLVYCNGTEINYYPEDNVGIIRSGGKETIFAV